MGWLWFMFIRLNETLKTCLTVKSLDIDRNSRLTKPLFAVESAQQQSRPPGRLK